MGTGNKGIYKNTQGALKLEHLMDELKRSGEKFTEEDVIAITKQKNGKIAWLEKGNIKTGLKHILDRHEEHFKDKGIHRKDIPNFLMFAIKNGNIVGKQGKFQERPRTIYEVDYYGKSLRVAISISKNGYIIGANPR